MANTIIYNTVLRRTSQSGRLIVRHHALRYLTTSNYHLQDKKTTKDQPSSTKHWENVEKRLQDYKQRYGLLQDQVDKYKGIVAKQVNNIKTSINEANKKIEEQEKEGADEKLNFKKDAQTSQEIVGLPSDRELHRKKWKRRLEFYLDSLQETIFTATRALNDVTGYSSIQTLRNSIVTMEKQLDEQKGTVQDLKRKYENAIETRTDSQKQLNELLQRKSSWSPHDLKLFTDLYQADATNSQNERSLKTNLAENEAKETKMEDELYRAILTRYHEEQIWSDKIRRTSTWGTFLLMGMNIVLFLVFQLLLEPWKRRRLTRSFEDKVKTALEDYSRTQNSKSISVEEKLAPIDKPVVNDMESKQESEETAKPIETADMNVVESQSSIGEEQVTQSIKSYSQTFVKSSEKLFEKLAAFVHSHGDSGINLSKSQFYIYSSSLVIVTLAVRSFIDMW